GKRVVDKNGLWLNDYLPPKRANRLTRVYDELDLHRTVHSKSGARIADRLLNEYGLPDDFRRHVEEVIHTHLMPGPDSSVEGRRRPGRAPRGVARAPERGARPPEPRGCARGRVALRDQQAQPVAITRADDARAPVLPRAGEEPGRPAHRRHPHGVSRGAVKGA